MRRYAVFGLLLALGGGCAPDIADTDFFREHPDVMAAGDRFVELGQQTERGLAFRLLAPDSLRIGHSTVWIEVSQGDAPLSAGRFAMTPHWVTGTRALVSPQGAARAAPADEEGRFEGAPFFLQPVGEAGHWELHVEYEAGGQEGALVFPVEVAPDVWVQHVEGAEAYYVSWLRPVRPATGNDIFEVALHRLTDQGFAPIKDAALDLYPYMDMGAGEGHSTPYEPPRHLGGGAYRGSVNFIMSGGWDLTVYVRRPGLPADTVVFRGFTVH